MANKTMGTLKVDFAGTREEAEEFVREHVGLRVGKGVGNEGCPQLTMRYVSLPQRARCIQLLGNLGWVGCIQDVPPTMTLKCLRAY